MARRVSVQAMTADEAAEGRLLEFHERKWLTPAMEEAPPTTDAIRANTTKKPVAWLPTVKYRGEKWAGSSSSGPNMFKKQKQASMASWLYHFLYNIEAYIRTSDRIHLSYLWWNHGWLHGWWPSLQCMLRLRTCRSWEREGHLQATSFARRLY